MYIILYMDVQGLGVAADKGFRLAKVSMGDESTPTTRTTGTTSEHTRQALQQRSPHEVIRVLGLLAQLVPSHEILWRRSSGLIVAGSVGLRRAAGEPERPSCDNEAEMRPI
jgi:hypothetical protein